MTFRHTNPGLSVRHRNPGQTARYREDPQHGYPPDKQEVATLTVLEQAAALSAGWGSDFPGSGDARDAVLQAIVDHLER